VRDGDLLTSFAVAAPDLQLAAAEIAENLAAAIDGVGLPVEERASSLSTARGYIPAAPFGLGLMMRRSGLPVIGLSLSTRALSTLLLQALTVLARRPTALATDAVPLLNLPSIRTRAVVVVDIAVARRLFRAARVIRRC
jgi:hypothetical protein